MIGAMPHYDSYTDIMSAVGSIALDQIIPFQFARRKTRASVTEFDTSPCMLHTIN